MPGENLDLTIGDGSPGAGGSAGPARASSSRPFVGIRFACCEVYCRVYIADDHLAYRGACPRCGRKVELKIGPGGTDARFFVAQ